MNRNRYGIEISKGCYLALWVLCCTALSLAGCQRSSIQGAAEGTRTAAPTEPGSATSTALPLATPYAAQPAAGICGEAPELEVVEAQVWPDVPSPRCLRVLPDQRLRLVNRTPEAIRWKLGAFAGIIDTQSEAILPQPLGQFLAPGVHILQTSPYSGPEIWVIGE